MINDIELFILKGLFENISYFRNVSTNLDPYFFDDDKGPIVNFIKKYFSKYEKIPDYSIVLNSLLNSNKYSDDLKKDFEECIGEIKNLDFDSVKDGTWLFDETKKFANKKAIYNTLREGALEIQKDESGGEADYTKIEKKMHEALAMDWNENLGIDFFDENYLDEIYDELSNVSARIPTGIEILDDAILGGIPGNTKFCAAFVGSAGLGKTLFLGNTAINAVKSGKNVLYLTFEIDEKELRKRIDANFTGLNVREVTSMRDTVKQKIKDAKQSGKMGRFIIKEFPPASISALDVESFLHTLKLKKQFKPDIIFLDYLGIMVPNSNEHKNSYEKGKAVCEEIRYLSDRHKCPIMTAVQTNRCLTLDTKVNVVANGEKNIGDVQIGDVIKSNNGDVTVTKIFPITKQKCYKITTKSGKTITCSGNHIFPTNRGEININDGLVKGDELIIG